MGGNAQSIELASLLDREEVFKLRGFSSECGPTGGVVVDRWGHVRGVWNFTGKSFFWTPAGYNEPIYRTESMDEAVHYTVNIAGKS